MPPGDTPIALTAYEQLAERYASLAETKAENGFIEQPAMRQQLGQVTGLRILEAGCGPGFLSSYLLNHGAQVTAFDISPRMIELAREKTQGRAQIFVGDMALPLANLKNASFDLVVSSLAIDYVRDWTTPLHEFYRVLKPQGRLVFSVQHPTATYLWYKPASAFGVQYAEIQWSSFGGEPVMMPDHYRSFADMINPILEAGFQIQKVQDTKPIEALRAVDPERFEKYNRQPSFMIFDVCKSPG